MSKVLSHEPSKLAAIKTYISQSMEELGVAGAAVAIVQDSEVILCDGFGKRDVEGGLPATGDTLFSIASCSKAFTTMAVSMLVDEGKVDWDTPVVSYLPEFKLHDKYATENATLRDLASHRVGLPRHDNVWIKAPISRKELLDCLPHLPFTKPLRTTFQYQNMMYVVLACVVEKVTGQTWEDFVQGRIFTPLGMKRSNFSVDITQQDRDHSKPYAEVEEGFQKLAFWNHMEKVNPAAGIQSSVRELSEWVKLHLNQGRYHESQLVTDKQVAQMYTPNISEGASSDEEVLLPGYGMGWSTYAYRGHQMVEHTGGLPGFSSIVAMLPQERLGVVVLTNQTSSSLPSAAARTIFDVLLGLDTINWNTRFKEQNEKAIARLVASDDDGVEGIPNTSPSHELTAYVGEYHHPGYGSVFIESDGDDLSILHHSLKERCQLRHFHYDIFTFSEPLFDGPQRRVYKVQFHMDLRGDIQRVGVRLEPGINPIEFVRKSVESAEKGSPHIG